MFFWIEFTMLTVTAGLSLAALIFIRKNQRSEQNESLKDELKRIETACNEGFRRNRQELGENLTSGRSEQGRNF